MTAVLPNVTWLATYFTRDFCININNLNVLWICCHMTCFLNALALIITKHRWGKHSYNHFTCKKRRNRENMCLMLRLKWSRHLNFNMSLKSWVSYVMKEKSRLACRPQRKTASHVGHVKDGLFSEHGKMSLVWVKRTRPVPPTLKYNID